MFYRAITIFVLCFSTTVGAGCFSFKGEYLFWKTNQADLDYAIKRGDLDQVAVLTNLPVIGPLELVDYDWDSGLRLGASAFFCKDICLTLQWTHLSPSGSDGVHAGENEIIGPTLLPARIAEFYLPPLELLSAIGAKSAKAHIQLDFDTVDLLLSKQICLHNCLSVDPYFGVQFLSLSQNYTVFYKDLVDSDREETGDSIKSSFRVDHQAAGVHLGVDSRFILGCGFSLFADVGGSLLLGSVDHTTKHTYLETDLLAVRSKGDQCTSVSGVHLGLGLDWNFRCSCVDFDLGLGYEITHIFEALSTERFYNFFGTNLVEELRGGLGFHGLIVKGGIAF